MTDSNTPQPPKRSGVARGVLLVAGAVQASWRSGSWVSEPLVSTARARRRAGLPHTPTERFAASTHALATENLELDLDGVQDVVSSPDLGRSASTWHRSPTSRSSWGSPAPIK